jgi:hypothetical protein
MMQTIHQLVYHLPYHLTTLQNYVAHARLRIIFADGCTPTEHNTPSDLHTYLVDILLCYTGAGLMLAFSPSHIYIINGFDLIQLPSTLWTPYMASKFRSSRQHALVNDSLLMG